MHFPPISLPFWLILAALAGAAVALIALVNSSRPLLLRKHFRILLALRVAALLALLLALLDPFARRQLADPDAYRVAVLADASASMATNDLAGGQSRLQWVSDWLTGNGRAALQEHHPQTEVHLFSKQTRTWDGLPIRAALPGTTAIGDALEALRLREALGQRRALGAVLLLSDGIQHHGLPLAEAAHRLAAAGIPVSAVGVGQMTRSEAVELSFAESRIVRAEGEPGELQLVLSNRFESEQSGQLQWFRGPLEVDSSRVRIPAKSSLELTLPLQDSPAGIDTVRAVFTPDEQHVQTAGHTAIAIVETIGDALSRVLYLGAHNGYGARFLRLLAQESPTLALDSIVRIDSDRFLQLRQPPASTGAQGQAPAPAHREILTALPSDPAQLLAYDAIVLDAALLPQLSTAQAELLARFVSTRGGGLLVVHSPDLFASRSGADSGAPPAATALPEALRDVLPARGIQPAEWAEEVALQVQSHPLFMEQIGGVLLSGPPPTAPAGIAVGVPTQLSRAAQVSIAGPDNLPVLVTHIYGAGRAAWLGVDFFWQWRLSPANRSREQFNALWQGLLGWLASGGRPRMDMPVNGQLLTTESTTDLGIEVLNADYSPAVDARVSALLIDPSGNSSSYRLNPVLESPGRFALPVELSHQGGYQVDYEVVFADGDSLHASAWFSASASGPESSDVAFRERELRDLARITGGRYYPIGEISQLASLPISSQIPLIERRHFWTRTLPFLLMALSLLTLDWWLRRRHGLR